MSQIPSSSLGVSFGIQLEWTHDVLARGKDNILLGVTFLLQEGFINCLRLPDNLTREVVRYAIVWIRLQLSGSVLTFPY